MSQRRGRDRDMDETTNNGTLGLSTGRLEALSDGILAIVMTLLVLLIEPPAAHLTEEEVVRALAEGWHVFLSYLISFSLIGIYWWRHHVMLHYILRADKGLVGFNMVFLMLVALIPFPTDLMTEYLNSPLERIALVIYGTVHILCALSLGGIWWYATSRRRLVSKDLSPRLIAEFKAHWLVVVAAYAVAVALSLVSVGAALLMLLAVPLLSFFPRAVGGRVVDLVRPAKG